MLWIGDDYGGPEMLRIEMSEVINRIVITDYEPYRTFGMTVKLPGLRPGAMRFTFEPAPDGTRVTRSAELSLGRGRLLGPAFAPLLRRPWRYEFAAVKRLIEAGG